MVFDSLSKSSSIKIKLEFVIFFKIYFLTHLPINENPDEINSEKG